MLDIHIVLAVIYSSSVGLLWVAECLLQKSILSSIWKCRSLWWLHNHQRQTFCNSQYVCTPDSVYRGKAQGYPQGTTLKFKGSTTCDQIWESQLMHCVCAFCNACYTLRLCGQIILRLLLCPKSKWAVIEACLHNAWFIYTKMAIQL